MFINEFTESDFNNDEYFSGVEFDEPVNAKSLSFDDKVRFLTYCLNHQVSNTSVMLNILLMIKGCTLDEESFEKEEIIFNDFEEYIDVKLELQEELDLVETEICSCFIGCIKGIYANLECEQLNLTDYYFALLTSLDKNTISKLFKKADINIKDVKPIGFGEYILESVFGGGLISKLVGCFRE